ncbi:MAG: hypothetical protein AAFV43_15725 [Planctomycetota bacterium]
MSNASIIRRMLLLIDEAEVGSMANGEFECQIEQHIQAVEGIDNHTVHEVRRLVADVCHAHFVEGDLEFGDPNAAQKSRAVLASYLTKISDC